MLFKSTKRSHSLKEEETVPGDVKKHFVEEAGITEMYLRGQGFTGSRWNETGSKHNTGTKADMHGTCFRKS